MTHWYSHLPKWAAVGAGWLVAGYAVASWSGIIMAPSERAAEQRTEVAARAAELSAVTQRAQQAEQAIYLLQYQQQQNTSALNRVNDKLDEMAMVLYSLERRSR